MKYQNPTFKTIKEALQYKQDLISIYGFEPESATIKVMKSTGRVPKGLIIRTIEETESHYILSPFYGMGYYVFVPKQNCKKIC